MKRAALTRVQRWDRDWQKRWKHASQPGYGMGMGRNTHIHKGRKP